MRVLCRGDAVLVVGACVRGINNNKLGITGKNKEHNTHLAKRRQGAVPTLYIINFIISKQAHTPGMPLFRFNGIFLYILNNI